MTTLKISKSALQDALRRAHIAIEENKILKGDYAIRSAQENSSDFVIIRKDKTLVRVIRGPEGVRGHMGHPGLVGKRGDRGFKGVKGDQGIKGMRGVSGHIDSSLEVKIPSIEVKPIQIDVLHKSSLNVDVYPIEVKPMKIEVLHKGARGEQGVQGKSGSVGVSGPRGHEGKQGEKGGMGDAGPSGIDGKIGEIGPCGIVGKRGDSGIAGIDGKSGVSGVKGDSGDEGIQGEQGEKGDIPKHEWESTRLRFQIPGKSRFGREIWGKWTDLQGPVGEGDGRFSIIGAPLAPVNVVSTTEAITLNSTHQVLLCDASSTSFTVTLPIARGSKGTVYHIKKTDNSGNTITVDANESETIDGNTTKVILTQYDSMMIVCTGTEWFII